MKDRPELAFTGERFTPECVREMAYEHWHRYALAASLSRGKRVLDAACGEGYGSALLAAHADSVDAVDLSEEAIGHARHRYERANLRFHAANCLELPFEDASFDAIVSFETLEHLGEQDQLLTEFRRVLRTQGWLLVSSPDKKTYSDETGYENEFHVRELYRDELEALIARHFPASRLMGQKLMFQSMIWDLSAPGSAQHVINEGGSDVRATGSPDWSPLYYIAACAAREEYLPAMPATSLYCDREESVYAFHLDEIRRNIAARGTLEAYEKRIEVLEARLKQPWWKRLLGR